MACHRDVRVGHDEIQVLEEGYDVVCRLRHMDGRKSEEYLL